MVLSLVKTTVLPFLVVSSRSFFAFLGKGGGDENPGNRNTHTNRIKGDASRNYHDAHISPEKDCKTNTVALLLHYTYVHPQRIFFMLLLFYGNSQPITQFDIKHKK